MRRFLLVLPFLLIAGEAVAVSRYHIKTMTCEQVKTSLMTDGKALLRFPSSRVPGMMRYGMYVGGRENCFQSTPQRGRVSTRNGTCYVRQCSDYGRSQAKW